jgi:hypothetical protein
LTACHSGRYKEHFKTYSTQKIKLRYNPQKTTLNKSSSL